MPVKVTKYRCGFKCGKMAMGSESAALKHESMCYKNPENKTCATCTNAIYEQDSDGFMRWFIRDCKIKKLSEFFDGFGELLIIKPSNHIKPLFHCPNYNEAKENETTEFFISDLIGKLQNKEAEKHNISDQLPF